MENAVRGEEEEIETVEDAAACVLAEAFGMGSSWNAVGETFNADERDSDNKPMRVNRDAIALRHQTDIEEQATYYLPADDSKWPIWATWLPDGEKEKLKAWSNAHPLQTKRGDVGEFEKWSESVVQVVMPRVRSGARAMVALQDAHLTPPQQAMLRVYALEDPAAAAEVLLHAERCGHRDDVALNALLFRVLFPDSRKLHHNVKERAWRMRMNEGAYRRLEYAAGVLLLDWLHAASVKFMRTYGPVRRYFVPSRTLKHTMPKRSMPRFSKGWDAQQKPGPIVIIDAGRATAPGKGGSSEGGSTRTTATSAGRERIAA